MIAAQLAERRRLQAAAVLSGASTPRTAADSDDGSLQSFADRREAELAKRKEIKARVELAARREADRLLVRAAPRAAADAREAEELIAAREAEEPEQLRAAKLAVASATPLRPQGPAATCAICGEGLPAREAKRLPCGHAFHFGCIDSFHMKKMHEDRDMELPCFTCGEPSRRSIATLADEVKRRREAEAAAAEAAAAEAAATKAAAARAAALATACPASAAGAPAAPAGAPGARRRSGGALAALARAAQQA